MPTISVAQLARYQTRTQERPEATYPGQTIIRATCSNDSSYSHTQRYPGVLHFYYCLFVRKSPSSFSLDVPTRIRIPAGFSTAMVHALCIYGHMLCTYGKYGRLVSGPLFISLKFLVLMQIWAGLGQTATYT